MRRVEYGKSSLMDEQWKFCWHSSRILKLPTHSHSKLTSSFIFLNIWHSQTRCNSSLYHPCTRPPLLISMCRIREHNLPAITVEKLPPPSSRAWHFMTIIAAGEWFRGWRKLPKRDVSSRWAFIVWNMMIILVIVIFLYFVAGTFSGFPAFSSSQLISLDTPSWQRALFPIVELLMLCVTQSDPFRMGQNITFHKNVKFYGAQFIMLLRAKWERGGIIRLYLRRARRAGLPWTGSFFFSGWQRVLRWILFSTPTLRGFSLAELILQCNFPGAASKWVGWEWFARCCNWKTLQISPARFFPSVISLEAKIQLFAHQSSTVSQSFLITMLLSPAWM